MMPRSRQRFLHLVQHLARHGLAALAVERAGGMRRRHGSHDRPEVRRDHDLRVPVAQALEDVGRARRVEPVQERGLEAHDEALGRRHRRLLLHLLRADAELGHALERVDEMNAFAEPFAGDPAEQRRHADVSGADRAQGTRRRDGERDQTHNRHDQPACQRTANATVHTSSCRKNPAWTIVRSADFVHGARQLAPPYVSDT